jgi:thymidylate synthase
MEFQPLFFGSKIRIVNSRGSTGVVTLWSRPEWVLERLQEAGIDLSPQSSPVAAVGNLYGNGLPELLRNLLYNPGISRLVVCGKDCSGSQGELVSFFRLGTEEVDFLGGRMTRIKGTGRFIDSLVKPETFARPPAIHTPGDLKSPGAMEALAEAFRESPPGDAPGVERVSVPLPGIDVRRFPSNPGSHSIVAADPLTAWQELIFRLVRFGCMVSLRKGDRMELQNVRVVVENPAPVPEERLGEMGFDPAGLMDYYRNFLCPELSTDGTYTYGHRIGSYFGLDAVKQAVENLKKDPEDRKSFISLWDTARDLAGDSSHPCLVSLYFRKFEGRLTLTAVFRTHNAMDAWLKNFYGLMRVQDEACRGTGLPPGPITVISHSISVDPRRLEIARAIAGKKGFSLQEDRNGVFSIEAAGGLITVSHYHGGVKIGQYQGHSASRLQHEMARDCAVSDVSHAIYLGRMLERAERCLKEGREFVQE